MPDYNLFSLNELAREFFLSALSGSEDYNLFSLNELARAFFLSALNGSSVSYAGSPSQANVNTALGLSAVPSAGSMVVYTDSVGGTAYLCFSDGTNWWSVAGSQLT